MSLSPASRLGPYEVIGLLDAGAMGEIYTARDTRLGRLVAVKVLPEAASADAERLDRLRQEALAAGSLNHPNVVSVHDVGTEGSAFFIVSELVEGRTLRERLKDTAIPPRLAVEYAVQIARGLSAAHEKGIVHRDLKPENVMIGRDDHVKILDFGVAKIDSPDARLNDAGLLPTRMSPTLPGMLLGTVGYMSPEQVKGEEVDARSDLFSLGSILYEMLMGRPAFGGTTPLETIAAILRDDPPHLDTLPRRLLPVVRRCLEKSPGNRYASAREVVSALEAVGTGTAQALASAHEVVEAKAERERTVAVLPFANVGKEPGHEYVSDGLTEQLIHELTRIRGVKVMAWHSASQLKGRDEDIHGLARQLGIGSVLVGSVRQAGDRVRIAARLVDTTTGFYLWSETYDRQIGDLFALQEEIARAIARTLERTLAGRPGVGPRGPSSVQAYDLYLRGRFMGHQRTQAGLAGSIECFEQAIAADETLALAHAGLADALCLMADYGLMSPHEAMPRARAAALRALDLDPLSGEAHASFALIHSIYEWEWEEAEAFYRRAMELNPGYATARHWFAIDYLASVGRFEEAHEQLDVARQLDPLSLIIQEGKPYLLMLQRRYDEAIEAYRALVGLDAGFYKAYTGMGRTLTQKGRYADGIAMLEKGRALAGEVPSIIGALGQSYGLAGDHASARRMLGELSSLAARKYVPSTCFALAHAGLGQHDEALTWLERGVDGHELPLSVINTHPAYDDLRGEPRFAALLVRMQFPRPAPLPDRA